MSHKVKKIAGQKGGLLAIIALCLAALGIVYILKPAPSEDKDYLTSQDQKQLNQLIINLDKK
jgi:hypothetical protein